MTKGRPGVGLEKPTVLRCFAHGFSIKRRLQEDASSAAISALPRNTAYADASWLPVSSSSENPIALATASCIGAAHPDCESSPLNASRAPSNSLKQDYQARIRCEEDAAVVARFARFQSAVRRADKSQQLVQFLAERQTAGLRKKQVFISPRRRSGSLPAGAWQALLCPREPIRSGFECHNLSFAPAASGKSYIGREAIIASAQ